MHHPPILQADHSRLHPCLAAVRKARKAGLPIEGVAVLGLLWHARAEHPITWEARVHLAPMSQSLGLPVLQVRAILGQLEELGLIEFFEGDQEAAIAKPIRLDDFFGEGL